MLQQEYPCGIKTESSQTRIVTTEMSLQDKRRSCATGNVATRKSQEELINGESHANLSLINFFSTLSKFFFYFTIFLAQHQNRCNFLLCRAEKCVCVCVLGRQLTLLKIFTKGEGKRTQVYHRIMMIVSHNHNNTVYRFILHEKTH